MDKGMLSLELIGEVPLEKFAEAMEHFWGVVALLSNEVAKEARIEWFVEELQKGSALVTVRGWAERPEAVEQVVNAYGNVGRALEEGRPVPYSEDVRRKVAQLTGILDGKVVALRFVTPDMEAEVAGKVMEGRPGGPKYAPGVIEGRVQTITERRGLKFTLYDSLFDRAITCYLQPGQEDLMRNAWGRWARVAGLVGRDRETGRPVSIRDVLYVTTLESKTGGYVRAKGILRDALGDEKPEDVIRKIRDAW